MRLFTTRIILLSIVILSTFFSCGPNTSSEPNIEKAITDLTGRFTQLPKGEFRQTDYYKIVRSVTNGERNFEIQLRSAPDSIEDPQQIIVLINSLGKYYAIPFFSNSYRDYWEFQFDTPIPNVKRTNTTFTMELMAALDTLGLNDTIGTGSIVIDEILFSLLHCVRVTESDSAKLIVPQMNSNYDIPEESFESCIERLKKNYQAISSEWHPGEFFINYNAYWDNKNHRIYQINNKEKDWRKKIDLSIKSYRQDYIVHLLTL